MIFPLVSKYSCHMVSHVTWLCLVHCRRSKLHVKCSYVCLFYRRKKKCIRYSIGEDDIKDVGCEVGVAEEEEEEEEDDMILHHGNSDIVTAASTTSSVLLSNTPERVHLSLPGSKRLMSHDTPVALQTIPT